ncbi:PQQ-binding-like beta-propeller repeat protein [Pontibacter sp. SGAir0037]|uniref:outer membrane protein assembly factor BamB family protein n=1 Tax=Pontibacter sp. SGAir0037 TaxID=2571030 RepID=UPI0010CD45D0|nr:PQQ-binding-like beta-propeller repeat protein [Pontibacter sp. SGAir0037]QCR22675.1 pyrrolo-quinoline quinone [Pontibacter sp. SGAir0037]
MRLKLICTVFPLAAMLLACGRNATKEPLDVRSYNDWTAYAGAKDGNRYSSNDQISTRNVAQLEVAWSYSSNDKDPENRSQMQCNPIIIKGTMYATSPQLKLLALDAGTGEEKWVFDPFQKQTGSNLNSGIFNVSRGVVYWQDEREENGRILYTVGAKLYAIDAATGTPVESFGRSGSLDLRENLDLEWDASTAYAAGTSPGIIYKDLLIIGMRLSEGPDALPGHVRAFDVRTGERKWIFHTIPHPGELGYDTWENPESWKRIGGANSWAGMSLDEKTGTVYIPTGSASPDFYGGVRKGQNLFANSLIALDAATGRYKWHYQVVHHDLWDRDLAANPNLVQVKHRGKTVDAVAQITKHGYIFLLDRETGQSLFPVNEVPVPASELAGEEAWPTQPIPTLPEPFARQRFEEEDVTDLSPETHAYMLEQYKKVKHRTMFAPPSKAGSWIFPGFDGGGEWGGAAVDVESGIMYVNSSEMPWALTMVDVPKHALKDASLAGLGRATYDKYCMTCHGPELKGNSPSYPSLVDLHKKYKKQDLMRVLDNGKNMMPSFRHIPANEKQALQVFLLHLDETDVSAQVVASSKPGGAEASNAKEPSAAQAGVRSVQDEVHYTMTGYNRFVDKDGYPGIKPPWGTLNAVDLNSGKLLWKVPLGEYEELTRRGIAPTGTENYGGPLVTKGGVIFIGATKDAKIRAFDKLTGKVLWEAQLPAPGYATPATYTVNGKQFVVIACGGGKIGSKSGDQYVAFALPEK